MTPWISIKLAMPLDNMAVDAWVVCDSPSHAKQLQYRTTNAYRDDGAWWHKPGGVTFPLEAKYCRVTHWMPIPGPPEETK